MDSAKTVIQELKDIFHDIIGTSSYDQHLLEKIHNYAATVKRALIVSEQLRIFFNKQEGIWDEAYKVAQRKEKLDKNDDFGNFYYDALHSFLIPQFEDLESAKYDDKEKLDKNAWFKQVENKNDWMKEMLNRIHPEIIVQLEKIDFASGIFYYPLTGVGWVKGERFRFSAERKKEIFAHLYKKMNEPISREDVLRIAGFDPDKATEGYFINELVRDLRDGTGLNPDELVLNEGLTLLGYKLESPPK